MPKGQNRWTILIPLLFVSLALAGQAQQEKETQAASFLIEADDAYARGDYQKAIQDYLLVAETSVNAMNLSRAHLGLSLCYFYLDDSENCKKSILKLLEIDPQKEASPLFYPKTYVDLFNEVKRANRERLGPGVVAAPAVAAPEAKEKPGVHEEQQVIPEGIKEEPGGHFEIDVHFSGWSLDLAKGALESTLTKKMANEIRDQVTDELKAIYGNGLTPSAYKQGLSLDSQGTNFGFEVRYYPLGRRGSMSIGLSLEKTRIKVMMKGPVTQEYTDGSVASVEGDASIETNPVTANLSFRWDFVPSWRVTPYLVLGLGLGPLEGTAAYVYTGTYRRGGVERGVAGDKTRTFDQLRGEEEIKLDRFILLHAALGVKAKLYKGLMLKTEAAFWDGLALRGGLAYRF